MKKLLKAALSMSMALAMVGCGSSSKNQTLIIGTSPDFPPFESKNEAGELEGFDIDMGNWIGDYLADEGVSVEWKEMSFDTIVSAVQTNQIDLGISGFNYSEERAEQVAFSEDYYGSALLCVVPKDSEITTLADLSGKTVGAQLATTNETAANELKEKDDSITVKTNTDVKILMEDLKSNGIDAVILDGPVAYSYAESGDYKILDEEVKPLEDGANYIIANKDNEELLEKVNKAIEAFKNSDDYATYLEKWGL